MRADLDTYSRPDLPVPLTRAHTWTWTAAQTHQCPKAAQTPGHGPLPIPDPKIIPYTCPRSIARRPGHAARAVHGHAAAARARAGLHHRRRQGRRAPGRAGGRGGRGGRGHRCRAGQGRAARVRAPRRGRRGACSPAGPPSAAMPDAPEGDPSASSSASGGGGGGSGDARPAGLRPGLGSGTGGGAHGRSAAVDASVLHGMLEFFVALARAAGGGWASTEGAPVPVRLAPAARLAWTRAPPRRPAGVADGACAALMPAAGAQCI